MTVASYGSTKVCFDGTHRVCEPDETLRRIRPLLPRMGITRLADVTWLDDIGVPVYQAVRPNAYLLSVSQGKGLSPLHAAVSAAMESIESWHAERLGDGDLTTTVAEVTSQLSYRLDELPLAARHHLNPAVRLRWTHGRHLIGGEHTLVPTDYLDLDGRTTDRPRPPLFTTTSNGLASGNTLEEAVLHGLYEVIERDALTRAGNGPVRHPLDPRTVDGESGRLFEWFRAAGVDVAADLLPSPTGLPCFRARIISDTFPVVFVGMGCHPDRDVALCRALTEAAQSRVTSIAGTRDDITGEHFLRAEGAWSGRTGRRDLARWATGAAPMSFSDVESWQHDTLAEDLRLAARRVLSHTGRDPIVVDHTREDLDIPVARVICPGLRHNPDLV
jgi:YcaO-like protein with predicted kinase domain